LIFDRRTTAIQSKNLHQETPLNKCNNIANSRLFQKFSIRINKSGGKLSRNKTAFYNTGGMPPIQVFYYLAVTSTGAIKAFFLDILRNT
jgi:hypothetical protein